MSEIRRSGGAVALQPPISRLEKRRSTKRHRDGRKLKSNG
jgi:hypothetical protein